MRAFAHPVLAIGFGAFILCAESCNHLDEIFHSSHWYELPIYDWSAGVFLVGAGITSRRDAVIGRPWQGAAWAYMVSLLAGAFIAHWEAWSLQPDMDGWISAGALVGIIGALLLIGVCGLLATLLTRR
jgi:hypothetical protein